MNKDITYIVDRHGGFNVSLNSKMAPRWS